MFEDPQENLPPECEPSDLALSLRWERSGEALSGEVVAANVGGRVCRLSGKPRLQPLGEDGGPLPVEQIISLEMRLPPFVVLEPGQRVSAAVGWGGWCGPAASGEVVVGWDGGSVVVTAEGPRQPDCSDDGSLNLTSGWFTQID